MHREQIRYDQNKKAFYCSTKTCIKRKFIKNKNTSFGLVFPKTNFDHSFYNEAKPFLNLTMRIQLRRQQADGIKHSSVIR